MDIKSIFNLVDIDKSGTVSRTVTIYIFYCFAGLKTRKSYKNCTIYLANQLSSILLFQLHFYWTFSFLGSQDGCKAIRKEVWNQRCKLKNFVFFLLIIQSF